MTEDKQSEYNLSDEFRNLGHNLMNVMRAAWDNPEREKLQQEIEAGLEELTSTVKEEVDHFNQSPTGQRIKSDIGELQERVKSGEIETKVRDDLLNALRTINAELENAKSKIQSTGAGESEKDEVSSSPEEK